MIHEKTKSAQNTVVDILCSKLRVSTNSAGEEFWDAPLTGNHFGLSSVDMVYLFFELEKVYNLQIDEQHLDSYGFNTINNIAKIVLDLMQSESRT